MTTEDTVRTQHHRPSDRHHRAGPVIVGTDGSTGGQRAMKVAAWLARSIDAELVVLHAAGLMTMLHGRHVPVEGHWDDLQRLLDDEWCAQIRDVPGLDWRTELQFGPAPDLLVERAAQLDASFVVVGSRGVRDEPEFLLGSTSHHVVHRCRRPVVVVPPAGTHTEVQP